MFWPASNCPSSWIRRSWILVTARKFVISPRISILPGDSKSSSSSTTCKTKRRAIWKVRPACMRLSFRTMALFAVPEDGTFCRRGRWHYLPFQTTVSCGISTRDTPRIAISNGIIAVSDEIAFHYCTEVPELQDVEGPKSIAPPPTGPTTSPKLTIFERETPLGNPLRGTVAIF